MMFFLSISKYSGSLWEFYFYKCHQGSRREYFSGGGQKFDKILNLPHYAWMTDKIVRPKELLIPPKNSPLYLKL